MVDSTPHQDEMNRRDRITERYSTPPSPPFVILLFPFLEAKSEPLLFSPPPETIGNGGSVGNEPRFVPIIPFDLFFFPLAPGGAQALFPLVRQIPPEVEEIMVYHGVAVEIVEAAARVVGEIDIFAAGVLAPRWLTAKKMG
uniref:Uncharacterized protein n=1 Tax=Candidatus Kentrum sp. TC TaxID=2126339 RepID=A0A450ZHL1_9GAMM|nr:MAG: hypothetical protein BECKTC1821F_GA0114240_100256 [Candidatus Kentron sp. TC]